MAWNERREARKARTTSGTSSLVRLPSERKSVAGNQIISRTMNGRPIWKDWDTGEAINAGYKASTWVYACITKRMKAVASVPMIVQEETDSGVWEQVPDDNPLALLIKNPNPFMTMQDMNETLVSHLDLGGNGLLSKVRARGVPKELWALPPDRVTPIPSRTDYLAKYEYNLDGKKLALATEDVVHFRYVDPANQFWGLSPLMAGGKTVDMEVEAVNWNKSAMQNRAVPDGMIAMKAPLTEKQFDAANKYLDNQLMGPANAKRTFVMGHDADYKRFSLSPAEMDFIDSRKMTREEICALFGVPPPIVGIYDKATLANIETARVIFWLDTIVPLLEDLQSVWNHVLAPDFGPGLRIVYDTSKVQAMQTLLKSKLESAKILFDMGLPVNDIVQRLDLGFDEIDGGDVGYLPGTLIPVNESSDDDF